MIKKLLVSTVAAATLSTAVMADTYAGAGLALENYSSLDMGFALVLDGGMTFDDVKVGPGKLAAEGELTYSIVSPSQSSFGTTIDYTIMTLGAYSAYIFDINKELYVKPRIGLIYKSVDASGSGFGAIASTSAIGLAFGVGGGYRLNKQMDVYADFNLVDGTDITHITAGVQYHF